MHSLPREGMLTWGCFPSGNGSRLNMWPFVNGSAHPPHRIPVVLFAKRCLWRYSTGDDCEPRNTWQGVCDIPTSHFALLLRINQCWKGWGTRRNSVMGDAEGDPVSGRRRGAGWHLLVSW